MKINRPYVIPLLASLNFLFFLAFHPASAQEKPRIFVLTDIENEPDDAMSMVRFLVYANQYDIEGLVATTSIHQRDEVARELGYMCFMEYSGRYRFRVEFMKGEEFKKLMSQLRQLDKEIIKLGEKLEAEA